MAPKVTKPAFLISFLGRAIFLLGCLIPWSGSLAQSAPLIANWKYKGFIYKNQFNVPLDPNLVMLFEFKEDGTNDLFWTRTGEPGFCQRRGKYSIKSEKYIEDTIVWVNPKNSQGCGSDPDMQLGRTTITEFVMMGVDRFHLILSLAGEPFIYVWEKIPGDQEP